jgi:hypothetical protein
VFRPSVCGACLAACATYLGGWAGFGLGSLLEAIDPSFALGDAFPPLGLILTGGVSGLLAGNLGWSAFVVSRRRGRPVAWWSVVLALPAASACGAAVGFGLGLVHVKVFTVDRPEDSLPASLILLTVLTFAGAAGGFFAAAGCAVDPGPAPTGEEKVPLYAPDPWDRRKRAALDDEMFI